MTVALITRKHADFLKRLNSASKCVDGRSGRGSSRRKSRDEEKNDRDAGRLVGGNNAGMGLKSIGMNERGGSCADYNWKQGISVTPAKS